MFFPYIQMFPSAFQENPVQSLKMSRMRLALGSLWCGRRFLGPFRNLLGSALRLPPKYVRFTNLNAPAPAPMPYRNRFWFRAPLLLLVPFVLLVTFLALRHSLSRETEIASGPYASLRDNWQSAIDVSTSASTGS